MKSRLHQHILGLGLLASAASLVAAPASGFFEFDGTIYSQNFNSLPSSLTAESGANVATDITGLAGWQITNSGSATSVVWRGLSAGTGTASGYYGLGASGDYALGGLSNGTTAKPAFGITLKNTSGATLQSLNLSFDVEQWRVGTTNVDNVLAFEYKISANYASIAGTTADASFLSPGPAANVGSFQNSTTASALDGNLSANRQSVTISLSSLNWAADQFLVLRWELQSGSLDALGIDNFSASAIPEPGTYGAILGAVALSSVALRRRR